MHPSHLCYIKTQGGDIEIFSFFEVIGAFIIDFVVELGGLAMMVVDAFWSTIKGPPRIYRTIEQMYYIGVTSSFIVLLTSLFVGMVEALQIYHGFQKFGAQSMIGYTVAISLGRELSPVMTALMIVARNVSAMAAEIGSMKVTEQIDALRVMAVDPMNFLVSPRIIATTIMMPFLVILSNAIGNLGGYLVSVMILHVNPTLYIKNIRTFLDLSDITYGLVKAAVFGFVISSIGCYMGMSTSGGSKGVGNATTKAVVAASVSVLVVDYFLTALLF